MQAKTQEKANATKLRRQGFTYNEICQTLGISKSTCSLWLRNININRHARNLIESKRQDSIIKSLAIIKQKREKEVCQINTIIQEELSILKLNRSHLRLYCSVLYWAEGAKDDGRVAFTNSDPVMILLFVKLLTTGFKANRSKFSATLHLHEYHDRTKQTKFWSHITKIPSSKIGIYLKPHTGKQKRDGYPGCISVRYSDARLAKELKFLYKSFARMQVGGAWSNGS